MRMRSSQKIILCLFGISFAFPMAVGIVVHLVRNPAMPPAPPPPPSLESNSSLVPTPVSSEETVPLLGPPAIVPSTAYLNQAIPYFDETEQAVREVTMFDYIAGTIAAEMPANFHPEALVAQGIAAHTRLLYMQEQEQANPDPSLMGGIFWADPAKHHAFLREESMEELYGEYWEADWNKGSAAAMIAAQWVAMYEDKPILAAYHATSAGMTEAAEQVWGNDLPYLRPVESEGDLLAPDWEVQVSFSTEEVYEALFQAYPDAELAVDDPTGWIEPLTHSEGGYIRLASVGGVETTGRELRTLFDLRSTHFTVELQQDSLLFVTQGYGHGVGLSQNGADFMARQGTTGVEIVEHYYQGAVCVSPN